MNIIKKALDALTRREPTDQLADESEAVCSLCDGTGWAPCRCGGAICVCENHGEKRCPNGCAEE